MKAQRQSGFTLVELMVSVLIGLFLVGGLLTLTSAMKRTYGIQGGLTQLADNERVAFTIMTDVIQQAGYFINPTVSTAATALPSIVAMGTTWAAGQVVSGTGDQTTSTETLSVRYMTTGTSNDGVLNCLGASSSTATLVAPVTWINTFSLDANNNLQCTVITNGVAAPAPVTLMTDVISLNFFYGVQTSPAWGNNSVDNILEAPQVTAAADWQNVISVEIVVYFKNPLYANAGTAATAGQTASQPPKIGISRWVVLMSAAGVTS
jgi:type IV pilus assembly protein PilW